MIQLQLLKKLEMFALVAMARVLLIIKEEYPLQAAQSKVEDSGSYLTVSGNHPRLLSLNNTDLEMVLIGTTTNNLIVKAQQTLEESEAKNLV